MGRSGLGRNGALLRRLIVRIEIDRVGEPLCVPLLQRPLTRDRDVIPLVRSIPPQPQLLSSSPLAPPLPLLLPLLLLLQLLLPAPLLLLKRRRRLLSPPVWLLRVLLARLPLVLPPTLLPLKLPPLPVSIPLKLPPLLLLLLLLQLPLPPPLLRRRLPLQPRLGRWRPPPLLSWPNSARARTCPAARAAVNGLLRSLLRALLRALPRLLVAVGPRTVAARGGRAVEERKRPWRPVHDRRPVALPAGWLSRLWLRLWLRGWLSRRRLRQRRRQVRRWRGRWRRVLRALLSKAQKLPQVDGRIELWRWRQLLLRRLRRWRWRRVPRALFSPAQKLLPQVNERIISRRLCDGPARKRRRGRARPPVPSHLSRCLLYRLPLSPLAPDLVPERRPGTNIEKNFSI